MICTVFGVSGGSSQQVHHHHPSFAWGTATTTASGRASNINPYPATTTVSIDAINKDADNNYDAQGDEQRAPSIPTPPGLPHGNYAPYGDVGTYMSTVEGDTGCLAPGAMVVNEILLSMEGDPDGDDVEIKVSILLEYYSPRAAPYTVLSVLRDLDAVGYVTFRTQHRTTRCIFDSFLQIAHTSLPTDTLFDAHPHRERVSRVPQ